MTVRSLDIPAWWVIAAAIVPAFNVVIQMRLVQWQVRGAAYSYVNKDKNKDRGEYRDLELSGGTPFGIRVNNRVSFTDSGRSRYSRPDRDRDYEDRDPDYRERDR